MINELISSLTKNVKYQHYWKILIININRVMFTIREINSGNFVFIREIKY